LLVPPAELVRAVDEHELVVEAAGGVDGAGDLCLDELSAMSWTSYEA
jgi:hypothetical protein